MGEEAPERESYDAGSADASSGADATDDITVLVLRWRGAGTR